MRRVASRLAVILLAATILILSVNARNVYAATILVTPNSVTKGGSFQVSGTGFHAGDLFLVGVFDASGSCAGSPVLQQTGNVDGLGDVGPVSFSSSGLGVGQHCVIISTSSSIGISGLVTVTSASTTLSVSPNPVAQGGSFQVSGTGYSPGVGFAVSVWADTSGSCIGSPLLQQVGMVDGSGNVGPVTFSSSSLGVGTHCVFIQAELSPDIGSVTVIPAVPIPEYPYGLPILAIIMMLVYGIVKRKTRI